MELKTIAPYLPGFECYELYKLQRFRNIFIKKYLHLGWILIDRSGKHFGAILNYLRDGSVPLPESKQHLEELLQETKFYLLDELSSEITDELSKKDEPYQAACRVPLITSSKEEKLILSSTTKV